jgi:hypothetical protein
MANRIQELPNGRPKSERAPSGSRWFAGSGGKKGSGKKGEKKKGSEPFNSDARPGLCRGRQVTGVPTAEALKRIAMNSSQSGTKSPNDLFREINGLCKEIDRAMPDCDREVGSRLRAKTACQQFQSFMGF